MSSESDEEELRVSSSLVSSVDIFDKTGRLRDVECHRCIERHGVGESIVFCKRPKVVQSTRDLARPARVNEGASV